MISPATGYLGVACDEPRHAGGPQRDSTREWPGDSSNLAMMSSLRRSADLEALIRRKRKAHQGVELILLADHYRVVDRPFARFDS